MAMMPTMKRLLELECPSNKLTRGMEWNGSEVKWSELHQSMHASIIYKIIILQLFEKDSPFEQNCTNYVQAIANILLTSTMVSLVLKVPALSNFLFFHARTSRFPVITNTISKNFQSYFLLTTSYTSIVQLFCVISKFTRVSDTGSPILHSMIQSHHNCQELAVAAVHLYHFTSNFEFFVSISSTNTKSWHDLITCIQLHHRLVLATKAKETQLSSTGSCLGHGPP
jgi:hypothetical protein